jgi:hypothetical protein
MRGTFERQRDGSKRTYALNDGDLRLALHFRELCPAVSGEVEGVSVVDDGFFGALPDRQTDERWTNI